MNQNERVAWLRRLEGACEHVLRDVLDDGDPYHGPLSQDVTRVLAHVRRQLADAEKEHAAP